MGTLYKTYHLINEIKNLLDDDEINIEDTGNDISDVIRFETEVDGNDLIVKVYEDIEHYPSQITDGEFLNNTFRIKIECE